MKSLEQIAEYVRMSTGFDIEGLRLKKRDMLRVAARQLFCYYARLSGYSLTETGNFLNIDHATALHGANRIELMKDTDKIIYGFITGYEMSEKKQIIEVSPNKFVHNVEQLFLYDFVCVSCNGRGDHVEYHGKETEMIECPDCKGTGKLRAKVVINWESDNKI